MLALSAGGARRMAIGSASELLENVGMMYQGMKVTMWSGGVCWELRLREVV